MTVKELPNGTFDVQDDDGKSLLDRMEGPFYSRETAEAAARVFSRFDAVDKQVQRINGALRNALRD